jgi:hypothetical protein
MENDTGRAREYLDKSHDNYVKNYLLSCNELSEGNLYMAKQYAEEVVNKCKDLPEGKVLMNLISRRESHPKEKWLNSYVFAFRDSGSPELSSNQNLLFTHYDNNETEGINEANCENIKIPEKYIGTPQELLLATDQHIPFCNTDKYLEILLRITPEMPFEIKLLALSSFKLWLDDEKLKEELRNRIKKKRLELIRQRSTEQTSYMYFAIMDIIEQMPNSKPLIEENLIKLEQAVSREKFGPSRFDLFNYYFSLYEDLNVSNPLLSAAMVTGSAYPAYPSGLYMSIEPTKYVEEDQEERLAKVLVKMAKANFKRRALIDYLIGSSLLMRASDLIDDKELEEKAREIKNMLQSLLPKLLPLQIFGLLHHY